MNESGKITAIDPEIFAIRVGKEYFCHVKKQVGKTVVEVDPQYFRPTEVELLIGNPAKSKRVLGWKPEYNLESLVKDMMQNDIKLMKKDSYLQNGGYKTLNYYE